MAKRTIDINFKSKGINDIVKELQRLQDEANKVALTGGLDEQFDDLAEKAKEVKEVLDDLYRAFEASDNKKKSKKSKELSEMEVKIADVKKAISSLTQQLAKANQKVTASVDVIDTAFDKINKKTFDGLLSQISNVQSGFDDLISKAKEYREVLSSPITVAPRSLSQSKNAQSAEEKELKDLQKRAKAINEILNPPVVNGGDKYLKKSDSELTSYVHSIENRLKQAQDKYYQAEENSQEAEAALVELMKIFNEYDSLNAFSKGTTDEQDALVNKVDETVSSIAHSVINFIRNQNKNDKFAYVNQLKNILSSHNDRIKELQSEVKAQAKSAGKVELDAEEKPLNDTIDDAITQREIRKKTVNLKLAIPKEEVAKVETDVNNIVDNINNSDAATIKIKTTFVSPSRVRNQDKVIQDLTANLAKLGDDPKAKEQVEKAAKKIEQYFKGDLKLGIDTTDIDRIEKGLPAAMQKIRDQVKADTLFLPVKLDPQDIHAQKEELEKELGTLTVPIGKIEIQDDLIDSKKIEAVTKEAKKKVEQKIPTWNKIRNSLVNSAKDEELNENTYKGYKQVVNIMKTLGLEADKAEESVKQMMTIANNIVDADETNRLNALSKQLDNIGKQYEEMRKARDKATEEVKDPGELLSASIIKFIESVHKIPALINEIKRQIGTVDIDGHVVVSDKQVQDALNDLTDLELHIARLDIYKPTLEKLKLTVKEDLVGLANAQKNLVNALNRFQKNLIGIQDGDAQNGVSPVIALTSNLDTMGKYLVDFVSELRTFMTQNVTQNAQANAHAYQEMTNIITNIDNDIKTISQQIDKFNQNILKGVNNTKEENTVAKAQSKEATTSKESKDSKDSKDLKQLYANGEKPKAVSKRIENETLNRLHQMMSKPNDSLEKRIDTKVVAPLQALEGVGSWDKHIAQLTPIANDVALISANVMSGQRGGNDQQGIHPLGNPHYITDTENAEPIIFYRGLQSLGAGTFKSGNYAGSWWSDNPRISDTYGNKIEVAKLITNNALEIDGAGFKWDSVPNFPHGKNGPARKMLRETNSMIKKYFQEETKELGDFEHAFAEVLRNLENEATGGFSGLDKLKNMLNQAGASQKDINAYLRVLTDGMSALLPYVQENRDLYGFKQTNEWETIGRKMGYDAVILKNTIDPNLGELNIASNIVSLLNPNNADYIRATTLDKMNAELNSEKHIDSSDVEPIASNTKSIENDVSSIASNVDKIASGKSDLDSSQNNSIASAIVNLIRTNEVAANTEPIKRSYDDDLTKDEKIALIRSSLDMGQKPNYTREVQMFGDLASGEVGPIITGLKSKVPGELVQSIMEYYSKVMNMTMGGHLHPTKTATPSRQDLYAFQTELEDDGILKQFIASRNELIVMDMKLIKNNEKFYDDVMNAYTHFAQDNPLDFQSMTDDFKRWYPDESENEIAQLISREMLRRSWNNVKEAGAGVYKNPIPEFDDWMKVLHFDDINKVKLSQINDLLGIKSQGEDLTVEQLLSSIDRNVASISKQIEGSGYKFISDNEKQVADSSVVEKQVGKTSSDKNARPSWYTGWNKQNNTERTTHAKRLSEDLEEYRRLVSQGDMSDLEYLQEFYAQYIQYANEDVANAEKKDKQNKRNFAKYVKAQQQANEDRIKLEKQKNKVAEQEDEAQRQAEQLLKERESKQDELAQRYANQQVLEASQEKKRADDEASKAKLKGRKQAKTEYVNTQKRQTEIIRTLLPQMDSLASNATLDGDLPNRINDVVKRLMQLKDAAHVSEEIFAGIKKECADINYEATQIIQHNEQINGQLSEQDEAYKQQNADRMKQIGIMANQLQKLSDNDSLVGSSEDKVKKLLEFIKKMQQQGSITANVFEAIETAFKSINSQAETEISNQKQMVNLSEDLEKIMDKKRKDQQYYMPQFLKEVEAAQQLVKLRQQQGQSLSSDEFEYAKGIVASTKNPDMSILTGDKSVLQRNIIKGEKMLSTNYLPGNLKVQLREVVDNMRAMADQTVVSRKAIDDLTFSFRTVEMEAAKAGKTFIGQIGQRLQDMNAKFVATYFSFMDIIRYMRTMISTITELDTALTEMRKVSDESLASLKEYQKTTFDTASALGTTAVQLQQSTADWLRLGESMDEASKSAVAATTLFNVSEFENINDATTALVAMSQAYQDLDKTEIIDVMNNIGNNYAIATDQLATALQVSASSLMVQGNDLYEAAALVTAGNQVIQDASKVGAGLRTISLRIAGVKEGDDDIKEELAELGEEVDDWVVSTQAKKRQVIMDYTRVASNNGQGVDILDSNGNLRDTYHILLDIAKIYKEIQEEDKKYGTNRAKGLVEELAGKNRSNIAASILMNPEVLEDVYESALDSAGSAAEENAKYLDSIVGKTQQFKNELQELEQNALDSELIKDVIDFGTTFLSVLNQAGDKLPTIIALVASLGATIALARQNISLIGYDKDQGLNIFGKMNLNDKTVADFTSALVSRFSQARDAISNLFNNIKISWTKDPEALFGDFFDGLDTMFAKGKERIGAQAKLLKNEFGRIWTNTRIDYSNQDLRMLFEGATSEADIRARFNQVDDQVSGTAEILMKEGVTSWEAYTAAEKAAGIAAKATSVGVQILNASLTMGISLLATFVVSKTVGKIKELANASKEASRAFDEFNNQLKSLKSEIKKQGDFIENSSQEFERLSQGVDAFGRNLSLSSDEFKRYNDLSNEIADLFPTLISGWDDTGKAILKTTADVKGLTEAYVENRKQALANIITGNDEDVSPEAVFKNYKELMNANAFETLKAGFSRDFTTAGVANDFDVLEGSLKALTNTTYEEFKNATADGINDGLVYSMENNGYTASEGLAILGENNPTENEYYAAQLQAQAYLMTYNQQLETALKGIRDLGTAYLQFNPDYDNLSEESKQMAVDIVNTIDRDLAEQFDNNPVNLSIWVTKTLDSIKNLDQDALSTLFSVDTSSGSFKETRDNAIDAWRKIGQAIDEEIEKNAENPEEVQRLQKLKTQLYSQSGIEELNDTARILSNNISMIGKSQAEIDRLNAYTQDFSAEQIDLWLKVTAGAESAEQAVYNYEKAIEKGLLYNYDSIGALLSSGGNATSNATWSQIKDDLVGLAQAGKLDENTLKEYEYFDTILQALGLSAEEAEQQISGMVDSINQMAQQNAVDVLNKYKNGVDSLGDAYAKYQKGEFIDASTLSAIQDTFGNLDSYQAFEEAVMRGEENLQQYFDNIVTEYAVQETALSELTEANKDWVKQQLVASGITEESAEKSIDMALQRKESIEGEIRSTLELMNAEVAENKGRKDLIVSTENLDKLTTQEITLLMQEANMSGTAAQAVALFALKKELAKDASLRNQDDINYLLQLINLADIGSAKVSELKYKLEHQQDYENAKKNADTLEENFYKTYGKDSTKWNSGARQYWQEVEKARQNADNALKKIDTLSKDVIGEINNQHPELDYTLDLDLDYGGVADAASEAGSAAAEEFKETLDKILAMYDAELDAGVETFKNYVNKSRAIIEQYYQEGKITASEYYDYIANLYEKQVSEYDKVISAVQRKIKEQIDSLDKEKESIEESYNLQIEEIQKKIDALQEENDEIDRNMALSRAQYQLARAQHQRTRLMYSESRGFYYEADLQGIADAQENVRKAQLDKTVSDLQRRITTLQDSMKRETDAIDEQIKSLNELSEAWGEVSSTLQQSIEDMRAEEILGRDWEQQIFADRQKILEDFTNQYVALQQAQKDAYLEARRAELDYQPNPTGNSGGGGGGNQGGGGGDEPPKEEPATKKTDSYVWSYDGKDYQYETEANKAKGRREQEVWDAAYKAALQKAKGPQSVREQTARGIADNDRANFAKTHKITKRKVFFKGTESAPMGEALVGELGSEIVLDKDKGEATIVDSPTLMKMKGGEKIFNAEETEKILKSKYVPLKNLNPKKFAMLHSFANGTSSPLQNAIAAQAVGIASGLKSGLTPALSTGAGQTINQTFNVSLPNITDSSKASDLFREFEQLQRKATQYFN